MSDLYSEIIIPARSKDYKSNNGHKSGLIIENHHTNGIVTIVITIIMSSIITIIMSLLNVL